MKKFLQVLQLLFIASLPINLFGAERAEFEVNLEDISFEEDYFTFKERQKVNKLCGNHKITPPNKGARFC